LNSTTSMSRSNSLMSPESWYCFNNG
jgi:hypothetical protein